MRHRYTSCRHPFEKPQWHALWLLAWTDRHRTPAAVADVVGRSAVTVRHVLRRWNDRGPDGVTDRRAGNGAARS
ncbi:helix-turn-helix domain-containing protein [bacterium]|nr:helix-turn-helix domain-containing protein [bacterium]